MRLKKTAIATMLSVSTILSLTPPPLALADSTKDATFVVPATNTYKALSQALESGKYNQFIFDKNVTINGTLPSDKFIYSHDVPNRESSERDIVFWIKKGVTVNWASPTDSCIKISDKSSLEIDADGNLNITSCAGAGIEIAHTSGSSPNEGLTIKKPLTYKGDKIREEDNTGNSKIDIKGYKREAIVMQSNTPASLRVMNVAMHVDHNKANSSNVFRFGDSTVPFFGATPITIDDHYVDSAISDGYADRSASTAISIGKHSYVQFASFIHATHYKHDKKLFPGLLTINTNRVYAIDSQANSLNIGGVVNNLNVNDTTYANTPLVNECGLSTNPQYSDVKIVSDRMPSVSVRNAGNLNLHANLEIPYLRASDNAHINVNNSSIKTNALDLITNESTVGSNGAPGTLVSTDKCGMVSAQDSLIYNPYIPNATHTVEKDGDAIINKNLIISSGSVNIHMPANYGAVNSLGQRVFPRVTKDDKFVTSNSGSMYQSNVSDPDGSKYVWPAAYQQNVFDNVFSAKPSKTLLITNDKQTNNAINAITTDERDVFYKQGNPGLKGKFINKEGKTFSPDKPFDMTTIVSNQSIFKDSTVPEAKACVGDVVNPYQGLSVEPGVIVTEKKAADTSRPGESSRELVVYRLNMEHSPFAARLGLNNIDDGSVVVKQKVKVSNCEVKPSVTTVTSTPAPVTKVVTTTPEPVVSTVVTTKNVVTTVTTTKEGKKTVVTSTKTAEPVTETVTSTPKPIVKTVVSTPAPVTVTEIPDPVVTTVTSTPTPVTIVKDPLAGSSNISGKGGILGLIAGILALIGITGGLGWFFTHNVAPVPVKPAQKPVTVKNDPNIVVKDGVACPAYKQVKGLCKPVN